MTEYNDKTISDMLAASDNFGTLAQIAGLDPASDFRNSNWSGVDFSFDDLTGFNFSGSDVSGSDFSKARGLRPEMFTGAHGVQTANWPHGFVEKLGHKSRPRTIDDVLSFSSINPDQLSDLNKLNLCRTGLEDMRTLLDVSSIESLNININPLRDLAGIERFSNLRFLDASDTLISDVSILRKLPKLENIRISRTRVNSVNLADNMSIRSFAASETPLSYIFLGSGGTKLRNLYLSDTKVDELDMFSKDSSIESIHARNTNLRFLDVGQLKNLRVLDVAFTDIQAIHGMRGAPVEILHIDGCERLRVESEFFKVGELYVDSPVQPGRIEDAINSGRIIFVDGVRVA